MATFKTILWDIEIFCNQHFQINEFGWGPISNISTKNHNFIMVWMLPTSARKEHSSTYINYNMYVFDILKQDGTNKIDVMNDTLMVGTDIISEFFDNEQEYGFVMSEIADAEPFDFMFDDFCGGWIFKVEIEYENSLNTCNIPQPIEEDEPQYNIFKNISGGTAVLETSSDIAFENDIIYITISDVESGKTISDINVLDEDGNVIQLTTIIENEEYSFTMPAKNVNINLTLIAEEVWTYEGSFVSVKYTTTSYGYSRLYNGTLTPDNILIDNFYWDSIRRKIRIILSDLNVTLTSVEIDGVLFDFNFNGSLWDSVLSVSTNPFLVGQTYDIKLKY